MPSNFLSSVLEVYLKSVIMSDGKRTERIKKLSGLDRAQGYGW
jgi:hypothetical protein